jgi:7,8-dihydro-6-hydroxymethylpterin-pyrophosphokinase
MRTKNVQALGGDITKLNAQLERTEQNLAKHNEILSKGKDTSVLYKEMEKYSKEKNKYTNNMLMLYSFLNITALGLLFYVYRSASE